MTHSTNQPSTSSQPAPRWEIAALAGLVVLGFALRTGGIGFGLPYAYHFDETVYTGAALNLGAGQIGPQYNPTGFINILFVEFAAYFVIGKIAGFFPTVASFGQAYKSDPTVFLMLSRLTSALLGTLTILVVYGLGKTWKNRFTGLTAALLLATAFLHVRDSHYGVPDVAAGFFVTLAVYAGARALREGKMPFLLLALATAGYAVVTKWSAWPVVVPPALVAFRSLRGTGPARSRAPAAVGFQTGPVQIGPLHLAAALGGGMALGGFQLALDPAGYLAYALQEAQAGHAGGFWIWQVDTLPGWLFYLKTLAQGLGLLLAAAAGLGALFAVRALLARRDPLDLVLLSFPVIYFTVMGSTRHYFARYALSLVPFAVLFAAGLLDALRSRLAGRSARFVVPALAALLVLQPLAASLRANYLLAQVDTRTIALRWIEEHVEDGARIAVDLPYFTPPLSTAEQVLPGARKIFEVTDFSGQAGLSSRPLDWYREQGFHYLIASSFSYNIPLNDPTANQERQDFYASLGREFIPVQEFRPCNTSVEPAFVFDEIYGPFISLWGRERPGPTIQIYRVK